ncbi:MAG: hypothetical protein JXR31_13540, partial [Prolixibacteraceae bacterium]|nr:hypothetical protein [Prolixibacteraceae bacterium]
PTPAAKAYHHLIYNEWWTNESGTTNSEGIYKVPAFFGKYKVTVNGVSQIIDLKKTDKKAYIETR